MKPTMFAVLLLLLLVAGLREAWGKQELSDQEMDQIAGGEISANLVDGVLQFQFGKDTISGRHVDGSGSVKQISGPIPTDGSTNFILRDNAQSNLSSFITVNAVNSIISLLVNLNVSINSTVGGVSQSNSGYGSHP
jgi:hypothetical protein